MTMLQSVSASPSQLQNRAIKYTEPRPQLPSKRKRETICGLGTFTKAFAIRPHPDSSYDEPVKFKPIRVISRSQLPLTFLDTSSSGRFHSNALFSAEIIALEYNTDSEDRNDCSQKVLIARHETKKTLYAIERVQVHVYSVCRLVAWLKEKEVTDLWDPSNRSTSSLPSEATTIATGEWWQNAVVATQPAQQWTQYTKISMMRQNATQTPAIENPQEPVSTLDSGEFQDADPTLALIPQEAPVDVPSAQEQLATLLQHYMDAVYMSKTSLAYFAKGPITRIRNTFTSPEQGAPSTHELTVFIRSMLLSPKASEKKYYEKLPAIIKAIPPGSFSDEEPVDVAVKSKASKKKVKLSREGVYPHEGLVVKKWWKSEMLNGDGPGAETTDQRIKRRIGDLRVREALAQLILMLEIVALEATSVHKPVSKEESSSLGDTQASTQPGEEPPLKPKKRERKLDDINLQLDLLLDKLCIWHATEEAGILDFDAKPSRQNEFSEGGGKNGSNDRLHSFCVEVIIPFYMNRLPEQALMVNKKLGGPAHTSPPKRKAQKLPSTSRKPGEPKVPDSKKSRRSLARVATETLGRQVERVTPSLSRSATDSAIFNGIKREASEAPLSAIPFQRSPSKSARQSMSQMRHLQGRQIDLSQPSAAATAKIKQKQRVEEDLQEAISALKKPNRGLAAGGYMADIEKRGLGSAPKSRKPVNPVRKIVKDIQVSATPRVGRRSKNMIEQTPSRHHHHLTMAEPLSTGTRSLSDFCIPSSGARLPVSVVPSTIQRSATARNLAHSSVAETPSKAPQTMDFTSGGARRMIFATPSKTGGPSSSGGFRAPLHVIETPSKITGSLPPTNTDLKPLNIAPIPTKLGLVSATEPTRIGFSQPAGDTEDSIYDALGWNDNDDDDMF